jgi:fluoride exporter
MGAFMKAILSVMAGGAVGAGLRYLVGLMLAGRSGFPYATLAVNLIGGFAMGMLAALVLRGMAGESVRLFIGVGVLGGFTTFSAFSLESFQMIERGQIIMAGGYAIASVVGSIAALALGYAVARV